MIFRVEQIFSGMLDEDPVYRQLLEADAQLEPEYMHLRSTLPDYEREILDRCIHHLEEMADRRLYLALQLAADHMER